MFYVALYRQSAEFEDSALCPGRVVATLPAAAGHAVNGARIAFALIDDAEVADPPRLMGDLAIDRLGIDRLELFQLPRAIGRWVPGYDAWLAAAGGVLPDRPDEAGREAGGAYPFLCEAGRMSREPIAEPTQQRHLAYVVGRGVSFLLGGWLVPLLTRGDGDPLPDVRGIFVYEATGFEEADRLAWQDPTAIDRFWTPLSFEPAFVAGRC